VIKNQFREEFLMLTTTSNNLYNALYRLIRQMHRFAHRGMFHKSGLYHQQAHLLHLISQNDGANQRDLAEQMDVRPSSMTEMLNKLERSGLIIRKQDEQDQRVMRIYLTETGQKSAAQAIGITGDYSGLLFNCLTEEEKIQMLAIIEKLCLNLETLATPEETDLRKLSRGHQHGPFRDCLRREHRHRLI
jgi:DNA-binding MarR family transcriptional regulator